MRWPGVGRRARAGATARRLPFLLVAALERPGLRPGPTARRTGQGTPCAARSSGGERAPRHVTSAERARC